MSKARRALLSIAALILGLVMGFAASTVEYRMSVIDAPLAVDIEGEFGATVVASVSGHANFLDGDELVEPVVTRDNAGSGRTVEEDAQVFAQVSTFHLDVTGRANLTGEYQIVGSATKDTLGDDVGYVLGEAEGSRIVAIEPESERAATIRVIDIMPTVLPGAHDATEASGALPSIAIGDDGIPTVVSGGGDVNAFVQADIITGTGEQIRPGDQPIINYLLIAPDGTVVENTWNSPQPTVLSVDDVFQGLNTALIDTRIGSRLVLAVPAGQAQGDTDVALVIDVLGKYSAEK